MNKHPYVLVAEALGCSPDSLNEQSALNVHPQWDSLGHLNIMMALEEHYGVHLDNDQVVAHQSMAGIFQTYRQLEKKT